MRLPALNSVCPAHEIASASSRFVQRWLRRTPRFSSFATLSGVSGMGFVHVLCTQKGKGYFFLLTNRASMQCCFVFSDFRGKQTIHTPCLLSIVAPNLPSLYRSFVGQLVVTSITTCPSGPLKISQELMCFFAGNDNTKSLAADLALPLNFV